MPVLAAAGLSAHERSGGALVGQVVVAARGEPVAGVTVRVEGNGAVALTDETGRFSFHDLPREPFVLVVEGPAVEPARFEIDPALPPETLVLEVSFAEIGAATVTVQGPRPDPRTASSDVIGARELAAVPRRTAEDALRLAPGVTLVQHGSEGKGYQFLVRGFDAVHGADFEATVEGMPVNEWSNVHAQGYLDLGFVIPEVIESVRVTKGPFTLDQGAFAMAGSADYHLGIPEADRGVRAAYTLGSTGRHRGVVTYSPKHGSGHEFIASETVHDEGFGDQRGIDRGALLGRTVLFDAPRHGSLSLLGSGYVARFELPTPLRNADLRAGRVGFYDSYDEDTRGASVRAQTALVYEHAAGRRRVRVLGYGSFRRLELLENFTGFLLDPLNGDRRRQRQDAWSSGLTLRITTPLVDSVDAELGAGLRGDALDQRQDHVGQREELLEQERELHGVQALAHALAGLVLEPVAALRFDVGARLDVAHFAVEDRLGAASAGGTLHAVSPRAVAAWRLGEPLSLFAAYGRGFRPPEARAFTSFEPDTVGVGEELFDGGEPSMTVADSVELGARLRSSRYLSSRLSVFGTFIARESVFDHVSGVNVELNATRRLGTEFVLRSSPASWLLLVADATLVDARFVDSGNVVPFAPWLFGGARAVVTHDGGWRGGLRLFAVAPRPLPHGARGATYVQLDATAGYHWERWRLDLELENLLNRRLREGEFHFASHFRPSEPASNLPTLHYFAGPPLDARLTLTALF